MVATAPPSPHRALRITLLDERVTSDYIDGVLPPDSEGDRSAANVVDLDERKEKILHTRVPDSLDRHIKRRARSLGMSVSTVVRNVLLTTFGLVEDIVNDSADIALAATGHETLDSRHRLRARAPYTQGPTGSAEVLAWQEVVLNLNAVCDDCNAILRKGTRAGISVRELPGPRAIICSRCLGKLERGRHNVPTRAR